MYNFTNSFSEMDETTQNEENSQTSTSPTPTTPNPTTSTHTPPKITTAHTSSLPDDDAPKRATLIEEFKHSFQDIWAPLVTENNALFGSSHSEESRQSLENSVMRYIDIARQLETWFAQRRIVLKTGEQEIDEEIQDLKQEIERKDNLINKVQERSQKWKLELDKLVPEIQK